MIKPKVLFQNLPEGIGGKQRKLKDIRCPAQIRVGRSPHATQKRHRFRQFPERRNYVFSNIKSHIHKYTSFVFILKSEMKEENLGRTNRLLSFHTTRTA
jgi:hypothetical protein